MAMEKIITIICILMIWCIAVIVDFTLGLMVLGIFLIVGIQVSSFMLINLIKNKNE